MTTTFRNFGIRPTPEKSVEGVVENTDVYQQDHGWFLLMYEIRK